MRKNLCAYGSCSTAPEAQGFCGLHYQRMVDRWNSPVYFIRSGGYVKIGYSKNPSSRLREVKTGLLHVGLLGLTRSDVAASEVVATEPGGPSREARLHAKFRDCRVTREWFRYSGEISQYVQTLHASRGVASRRFDRDPVFEDEYLMSLMQEAKAAHERFTGSAAMDSTARDHAYRERALSLFNARSEGVGAKPLAEFLGVNRLYLMQITHPGEGDSRLDRWINGAGVGRST